MSSYRIAFAGTPDFAVPSLEALIQHSLFDVVAVLTQPDRPAGRGQKLQASPIKKVALAHDVPVYQPVTLKEFAEQIAAWHLDALIVAAYGLIIPSSILSLPRFGCINVHGSLLPRWRGAAPVQRAIEAGDKETGVDIMQMEKGLDTGPVFYEKRCVISPTDTGGSLMQALAKFGAEALIESLPKIFSEELIAQPQDHSQAVYAHKLSKEEARIDWTQSAEIVERRIRAFNPWPMSYFDYDAHRIKVGAAEIVPGNSSVAAGTLLQLDKNGMVISCGKGALRLTQIQLPGGKMQAVEHYLGILQK